MWAKTQRAGRRLFLTLSATLYYAGPNYTLLTLPAGAIMPSCVALYMEKLEKAKTYARKSYQKGGDFHCMIWTSQSQLSTQGGLGAERTLLACIQHTT